MQCVTIIGRSMVEEGGGVEEVRGMEEVVEVGEGAPLL